MPRILHLCLRLLSWLCAIALQCSWRVNLIPVFDPSFYVTAYPDVAQSPFHPFAHFLLYGWREGRQPNSLFDTAWYTTANTKSVRAGRNPLIHYMREGWREDRQPSPFFDPVFYREANAVPKNRNPLLHYTESIRNGTLPIIIPGLELCLPACETEASVLVTAEPIDIIISVLSEGIESARECIASVLGANCRNQFEIVLIGDLAHQSEFRTAPSVRDAVQLHPNRDIILLNVDATVAHDWLDRLAACVYSCSQCGTASPLTSELGWCWTETAADLDEIVRRVNAGKRAGLTQANAWCMYIRRDCIAQVGLADTSDFSKRAANKGWKHLLAGDVYVATRVRAAADIPISAKWITMTITAARVRSSGASVKLHVSHSMGGGVEEYLRRVHNTERSMLVLRPASSGLLKLSSLVAGACVEIWADPRRQYANLLALLRSFNVNRITIEHLLGHDQQWIRELAEDLKVPVDFTIHDYFAICPQITLTSGAGVYCGEPAEKGCNRCISDRSCGARDIASWRREHKWLLSETDRVRAPSVDAAKRFRRYFPNAQIDVVPHPEPGSPFPLPRFRPITGDMPLRIAVLGTMKAHKGVQVLRQCAAIATTKNLPLTFTLIGDTRSGAREPFRQTGRYTAANLPTLLDATDPHIVWFPGKVAETYSFTLSECLQYGLPVAAPDLGAFPERLYGRRWSWVLPWSTSPEEWVEFFIKIRREQFLTSNTVDPDKSELTVGDVQNTPAD